MGGGGRLVCPTRPAGEGSGPKRCLMSMLMT